MSVESKLCRVVIKIVSAIFFSSVQIVINIVRIDFHYLQLQLEAPSCKFMIINHIVSKFNKLNKIRFRNKLF